jgi:hypothetical protein
MTGEVVEAANKEAAVVSREGEEEGNVPISKLANVKMDMLITDMILRKWKNSQCRFLLVHFHIFKFSNFQIVLDVTA